MDFLFTKPDADDPMARHDAFNLKYPGELLDSNWSSSHDILDSIFSMDNDFLNDYDHTKGFDTLDDLSKHIKMEAEEYEMTIPSYQPVEQPQADINPSMKEPDNEFSNSLSSNSSDSGLSSDNLDIEMSPNYGPPSPAVSSPGPSISERYDENKDEPDEPEIDVCSTEPDPIHVQKPANVIVRKIPQIITLPSKAATSKFNIVNGKDIKIVKLAPQMLLNMNNKKVTMQVKNPVSPAKCQTSPGTFFINNGKLTEVKKLVRVQNASNPRSVLLPVSIQDVKDFKTFKIINASSLKTNVPRVATAAKITPVIPKPVGKPTVTLTGKVAEDSLSDNTSDGESIIFEDINSDNGKSPPMYQSDKKDANTTYSRLILTVEEKRLLAKEGITLPSHYPLTKHEERELKRIRRKIRNKISAQDSRKRKKEYVDGLEERVKQCTEENQTLMKRIKMLQTQNHNLMSQMKKLQTLLSKGTNKTAQPTTCLMVLLLSLALIAAPNLKLGQNAKESELEEAVQETMLQNRRNLLFDTNTQNTDILDEEINMSEIFSANDFNGEREFVTLGENCKSASFNFEPSCKKVKFIDFDIDEQNWYQTKETLNLQKSQNAFNNLAQEYQESKKSQQTSGFNIGQEMLDKDVMDMISPKSNGLYELNIEKGMDFSGGGNSALDVATSKHVYVGQVNNLNSSESRKVQKY